MSKKTSYIFKGVLENAGLGEVAFFLKKAKQNLAYASYALSNTNFDEVTSKSNKIEKKMALLNQAILEIDDEIDNLGLDLARECEGLEE